MSRLWSPGNVAGPSGLANWPESILWWAGGVFWRLLLGYEQEGRAGHKSEGLLGGWLPQKPPKLLEVIIAKLLSLLESALASVSTPAASTNLLFSIT